MYMRTFKSLMLSGDACRENCLFMLKTPILNTWELHELKWTDIWWWWNDKTENECMFFSNIDFTNGILIHSTNLQPISFFSSHWWYMIFNTTSNKNLHKQRQTCLIDLLFGLMFLKHCIWNNWIKSRPKWRSTKVTYIWPRASEM